MEAQNQRRMGEKMRARTWHSIAVGSGFFLGYSLCVVAPPDLNWKVALFFATAAFLLILVCSVMSDDAEKEGRL